MVLARAMDRLQAVTRCQHCNVKIAVSGLEDLGKDAAVASRQAGLRSMMAGTSGGRLDESFVVLDPSKHTKPQLHGTVFPSAFCTLHLDAKKLKWKTGHAGHVSCPRIA